MKWYECHDEKCSGVVISSRVRLARNLSNYVFPNRISDEDAKRMIEDIKSALFSANEGVSKFFEELDMKEIDQVDQIALLERHLISPHFMNNKKPHTLILSEDESISVMVNEEDHIRIQSLTAGMNLSKALEDANRVDDLLHEKLKIAFDERLGYLTACPTNLGTGLRASYMVHVPALETTGRLKFLLEAIQKFGLTVRGIYGEGSEAQGSIFQISNQITLGSNETEIIDNLTSVTKQIVEQEMEVRNQFLTQRRLEFEDAIYRSYGLLKNARILSSEEAMSLLSDIRLGLEIGIVKSKGNQKMNIFELMTKIQPANLQKSQDKHLSAKDRDVARATYIREHLVELE